MKNYIIEIRWAFIFTVATLLWAGIEKLFGMHDSNIGTQPIFSLLFGIPAMAIYFLALLEKKQKVFNGVMSWKEGVVSGIMLSVFIAVLSPIAQWAIFTHISPEFFAKAIAHYLHSHQSTETKAREIFNLSQYMRNGIRDALSMGVLTSAVVALFVKTKTPTS